jgi:molecular chaperone HscA
VEASVQIKPSYGLQDTEIEQMLRDSFTHAKEDVDARNLREQQVEAGRVIEALTAALQEDGKQLLSDDEYAQLNSGIESLTEIAKGTDYGAIKKAMDQLNTASADFAARRMDASIRAAMAGHTVDEFSK